MKAVTMQEASTHFSDVVQYALAGNKVVVLQDGKPLVMLSNFQNSQDKDLQRYGFMDGEIDVPDDFDSWNVDEFIAGVEGSADEVAS